MSAAEDQAAVEKVLDGDTSSFEDSVRRWQGPLVNLAYRFCRDRGRAEEMAQEAFLRAYRSLAQWRREAAHEAGAHLKLRLPAWELVVPSGRDHAGC